MMVLPAPVDRRPRAQRFIVIPLGVGRGGVFGALQLEGATRLDRDDLEFVNAITNQLAIALDRDRMWRHDVLRRREAQLARAKYESLVDHLEHAFVWEADVETRRLVYARRPCPRCPMRLNLSTQPTAFRLRQVVTSVVVELCATVEVVVTGAGGVTARAMRQRVKVVSEVLLMPIWGPKKAA